MGLGRFQSREIEFAWHLIDPGEIFIGADIRELQEEPLQVRKRARPAFGLQRCREEVEDLAFLRERQPCNGGFDFGDSAQGRKCSTGARAQATFAQPRNSTSNLGRPRRK